MEIISQDNATKFSEKRSVCYLSQSLNLNDEPDQQGLRTQAWTKAQTGAKRRPWKISTCINIGWSSNAGESLIFRQQPCTLIPTLFLLLSFLFLILFSVFSSFSFYCLYFSISFYVQYIITLQQLPQQGICLTQSHIVKCAYILLSTVLWHTVKICYVIRPSSFSPFSLV